MEKLMNILERQRPSKRCDKNEIQKAFNLLNKIDTNNCMIATSLTTLDAGNTTLYAVYEEKLIRLSVSGGYTGSVVFDEFEQILDILNKCNFYTWELRGKKLSLEYTKSHCKNMVSATQDSTFMRSSLFLLKTKNKKI